jgi:hypothetical protein
MFGAAHVDLVHAGAITNADLVPGGEVVDDLGVAKRAGQRRRLGHVAGDEAHTGLTQRRATLGRTHQRRDVVPTLDQRMGEAATDEPGRAGNEHTHTRDDTARWCQKLNERWDPNAEVVEPGGKRLGRELEDGGERLDVVGANREHLAVEVAASHLDHVEITLQHVGLR